ncbi:MAG: VOC family protein [Candidatus Acidiferrum sp.]|jgi:PhnB protein
MQVNPYLVFNGQCEAAFKFYEKVLGAKIEAMFTHGGSPMEQQVSPEWRSKIMHARMTVGNNVVMGSDAPPDHYRPPQGFSVSIGVKEPADAERIFNDLSQNGKIQMPIQKTFWSARFGMLVDQFGIPWMVNCDQPA